MCIIIAKYKNGRIPTKTELKNSFEFNPDGAGFMYVNNGKVIIDKGYMDYDSFINRFDFLCKKYNDFKDKSLIIHCRIGTSSSNTAGNTHPYPISNKEKDLHKKYIETDLGVVHNGIISKYTPHWKNPTTNDTQEFIMKYLAPLYKNYKEFYKNKYIMNGIENVINSKLAFLDTNDKIYFVGEDKFIEEDKGLFFSNDSYEDKLANYKYMGIFDDIYDDWYYDEKDYKDKGYKNYKSYKGYKGYGNNITDFSDYYKAYNKEGEDLKYSVYDDDLEFLEQDDYIYNMKDEIFRMVGNTCTAYDMYDYNLYEIIGNKAVLIGNIIDDNIELFDEQYERIM